MTSLVLPPGRSPWPPDTDYRKSIQFYCPSGRFWSTGTHWVIGIGPILEPQLLDLGREGGQVAIGVRKAVDIAVGVGDRLDPVAWIIINQNVPLGWIGYPVRLPSVYSRLTLFEFRS